MQFQGTLKAIHKPILFSIAILFHLISSSQATDEPATVDDLFKLVVEEWANPRNLTTFGSWTGIGADLLPFLSEESNFTEVNKAFEQEVIHAEARFGYLPEYWELRAYVDLRTEGLARRNPRFEEFGWPDLTPFLDANYDWLDINPLMLQKASDLDPNRGAVKWVIGQLAIKEQYPARPFSNLTEEIRDIRLLNAKYNADAALAEPSNAFYWIYQAANLHAAGQDDTLLDLLEKAAKSDSYDYPRIFPYSYAAAHVKDFEQETGPFENLSPGGSLALYNVFYNNYYLPDFIIVRNLCRDVLTDAKEDDNWREVFTTVHRAFCTMGMYEEPDPMTYLVAGSMVKICIREGLDKADEIGDTDLKVSLIALLGQIDMVKNSFKAGSPGSFDQGITKSFVYRILSDYIIEVMGGSDSNLTSLLAQFSPSRILPRSRERDFHEEFIKPFFENISTFDYAYPTAWYEKWYAEEFPPPE